MTVEGAVAEALVWDFLDNREIVISSTETGQGGPDFVCASGGRRFFVEVTNISRRVVTYRTRLTEDFEGARHYRPLTRQIKREVQAKATQFARTNLDAPLVVFVTTLHLDASLRCTQRHHVELLLRPDPSYSWPIDTRTGAPAGDGCMTTDMWHSVATRSGTLDTTRRHISATVVGGFGFRDPPRCEVRGVLHPDAIHPFDPGALVDVDFCQFANWPPIDGRIKLEWIDAPRRPEPPPDPETLRLVDRVNEIRLEKEERDRFFRGIE